MAQNIITAQPIAPLAVELLSRALVLPNTVLRTTSTDYSGSGGTVTVRVRAPRLARQQVTRGADIIFDDIEEFSVDVSVGHYYNASLLSDEDMTLDIVNFGGQVVEPQVNAVAQRAENELGAVLNAVPLMASVSTEDARGAVLDARQQLTEWNVPAGRRWLAVGPGFASALMDDPRIGTVDQSGTPSALRDAVIGKLYGFTVVETNALPSGTAVGYHESAAVFSSLAPVSPRGETASSTSTVGGVSLRHVVPFVPTKLSHASVVSTFAGAAPITEDGDDPGAVQRRAVRITLMPDALSS